MGSMARGGADRVTGYIERRERREEEERRGEGRRRGGGGEEEEEEEEEKEEERRRRRRGRRRRRRVSGSRVSLVKARAQAESHTGLLAAEDIQKGQM